ncbi:hypothetical protein L0P88_04465 [Muricauda sp. SCSIO 64092]|uniref:hypothetical protein n=1 Tax=Allomuricauda sp. SCSIO 64092 TaxID=2908842 RepID=UPI001FF183B4|nr:hypothetical protein [Muricauda sp. SCSIO 64092]UOY07808.1 hypothetical protein L0P88_04465 [Muricauda sp. SCSIO 64092]
MILIILVSLVHCPTLHNDFQEFWDDQWAITNNPYILNPTWENMNILFTTFYNGQYAPLNVLYYLGIHQLFGFNPAIFHLFSLLFHLLNVYLVYLIVYKLIKQLKKASSENANKIYAFLVALIFGIHPLQVESVAWVSASKVLLYSTFYLLSILLYIRYLRSRNLFLIMGVFFLYTISIGFKEQGIVLPLTLILLDFSYNRLSLRIGSISPFLKAIGEKIPFFLIALSYWIFSSQFDVGNLRLEDGYPLPQRILFGTESLMDYLFRFLAPINLYYYYPFPNNQFQSFMDIQIVLDFVLVLAILGYFIKQYYTANRILVFAFLFFTINIFLVLHVIPIPRTVLTADRYIYMAIIGPSLATICILDSMITKQFSQSSLIKIWIATITFMALGLRTFIRTIDWKDSKSLKMSTLYHKYEQPTENRKGIKPI